MFVRSLAPCGTISPVGARSYSRACACLGKMEVCTTWHQSSLTNSLFPQNVEQGWIECSPALVGEGAGAHLLARGRARCSRAWCGWSVLCRVGVGGRTGIRGDQLAREALVCLQNASIARPCGAHRRAVEHLRANSLVRWRHWNVYPLRVCKRASLER